MRVSLVHTVTSDPERLARLEQHRARIADEMPAKERAELYKRRRKPKVIRVSHGERWARKIDRLNAMGSNWGWSQ